MVIITTIRLTFLLVNILVRYHLFLLMGERESSSNILAPERDVFSSQLQLLVYIARLKHTTLKQLNN